MSARSDRAAGKFLGGCNCAQAVLSAFADEGGLGEDLALKVAAGLGGGMGRSQEVCGAVAAGILVLGLRHGRGPGDREVVERVYGMTKGLMGRFAARHGSFLCRDLLKGYDLGTEEGRRRAAADDTRGRICLPCGRTVAELLEEMK